MKRTLLILMALMLSLSLTTGALAAGGSAPKNLCLKWDPYSEIDSLSIKKLGAVPTSANSVTYYSISGTHIYTPDPSNRCIPLVGTGYMLGSEFHFSYTGSVLQESTFWFLTVGGHVNIGTGVGSLTMRYTWTNAVPAELTITITVVPCDQNPAPQAFPAEQQALDLPRMSGK